MIFLLRAILATDCTGGAVQRFGNRSNGGVPFAELRNGVPLVLRQSSPYFLLTKMNVRAREMYSRELHCAIAFRICMVNTPSYGEIRTYGMAYGGASDAARTSVGAAAELPKDQRS
jgi:hypothetical protein